MAELKLNCRPDLFITSKQRFLLLIEGTNKNLENQFVKTLKFSLLLQPKYLHLNLSINT
jgi:hypothetical protein